VLGRFYPLLTQNIDRTPMIGVASYTNFGQVDTQGVDLGMTFYLNPEWTLNLNYSWFDFDIKDSLPGLDRLLLPNSPENKYAGAISYGGQRFDFAASYRWVDAFRWAVGPFQGDVPSYGTADFVANLRVTEAVELGINIANIFDEQHWEAFGGDLLGRRALGSVTFRW
jgi:outer membrane receptor protein involved in Fe transport